MDTLHECIEIYCQNLAMELEDKGALKKVQKLKTVTFQVLYPIMGQPNASRNHNQALLKKIPTMGLIETYDEKVREEIEKRKQQGDKSAAAYESSWKHFISWLSDRSDYRSDPVAVIVNDLQPSFSLKAPYGKGLESNLPKENPHRTHLVYAVKEEQLLPHLNALLDKLEQFCHIITPSEENRRYRGNTKKQKKDGMRKGTFNTYKGELLRYLGWLTKIYGHSFIPSASNPTLPNETKNTLLTQSEPADLKKHRPLTQEDITITLVYDQFFLTAYIEWQLNVRKNSFTQVHHICNLAVKLAQCNLNQEIGISRADAHPIVQNLMVLRSKYDPKKGEHLRTSVAALEKRLLEHEDCEKIVKHLGKRAKFFEQQWKEGEIARREVVEDAWQDYLIIAMLTYGAMRQREIREMKLDEKRLCFDARERVYWCRLFPADHKTHGDREYPLFPGPMQEQLTNDFTYYWETIRPNLEHHFVFFNRGTAKSNFAHRGNPIPKNLSQLVKRIMYNASLEVLGDDQAKAMTPHDFRRSSATWFAHYGNIEDGFVFAQLHGHSVQMLLDLYAQVRSKEQTKQATSVFNRTSAREQASKQQGSEQDNRVWLKQFADRMSPETLAKVRAILETSFSA